MMDQSFWLSMTALGSLGAAGAALWYAILARRSIRASLLSHILTKYSSKERFEASVELRLFEERNKYVFESIEKARRNNDALSTSAMVELNKMWQKINPHRGYLSALFWEIKNYCEADYIPKKMIAKALGKAGHGLYLELVEPLDWLNTNFILNRDDYDDSIRAYFEESLRKYFS